MRYARRVKNNPSTSLIYTQKDEIESHFGLHTHATVQLTYRLRLILFIFALCFFVMIYGVSRLEWWFTEMITVFFTGEFLIGFLAKINEYAFLVTFVIVASELMGVEFIIGIVRGDSVLMNDGLIN